MNNIFRVRALAALSALALVLPAAASAQRGHDRVALLLNDKPPARSRGCHIENRPNPLPTPDALVDTAKLSAVVREYATANHVSAGDTLHLLMSLGWDKGGEPERANHIDWFLPEGAASVLIPAVRSSMKKQRGEMVGRLRIDVAPEPVYHVGRSEVCDPMGLERVDIQAPAVSQVERPHPVRVRVTVGANGEMLGSSLLGSSGQQYWDDVVTRFINSARYSPGLVDGQPVVMQYEQTVNFQAH